MVGLQLGCRDVVRQCRIDGLSLRGNLFIFMIILGGLQRALGAAPATRQSAPKEDFKTLHVIEMRRDHQLPPDEILRKVKAWNQSQPKDPETLYWIWYVNSQKWVSFDPLISQPQKLLEQSAAAGFVHAKARLAIVILEDRDHKPDRVKAKDLLDQALKVEDPFAHIGIAEYLVADGAGAADFAEAEKHLTRAAELGCAFSWRLIAGIRFKQGDMKGAFEFAKRGVDGGDTEALITVSQCYRHGLGVAVDYDLAFRYGQKAAAAGWPEGLRILADYYHEGIGVDQNLEKAYENYVKGAKYGDVISRYWVAQSKLHGEGTKQDKEGGAQEMVRLATAGYPGAEFTVGQAYKDGSWMGENEEQARYWLHRALNHGIKEAGELLDELDM